ncbi:DUF6663 family protein [Halalkalirubrum salinum]|uniref:DUF6663 family protein n=1 Tax=Halalkalirubrum salinum TaxID=2563889 RepID=UPI0010FB83EF|nr:DUF6663 family protein [Halalkalirubrum salinum]
MDATTTDRYRVLSVDRDQSLARLISLSEAVTAIDAPETANEDALAPIAAAIEDLDLHAGSIVEATIEWDGDVARVVEATVERADRIYYAEVVEGMYEAAVEAWHTAQAAGEGMHSIVTQNTDTEPNGVLYVFADGPGGRTIDAIRTGGIPIEPLIQRAETDLDDDNERAVFVLEPADHAFVAVHIVFRRDGVLARMIADTYDIDR